MKEKKAGLKLIRPEIRYAEQVMRYRDEMLANHDRLEGCSGLEEVNTFEEWSDFEDRLKRRFGSEYVPTEVFLCVRERDDKVVGFINYRHPLTPFLQEYCGNIGYSVLPSERRKGYATEMLRLLLPICKAYGEERVLITCERSNEASARTILRNGGKLQNEIRDDFGLRTGGIIQRYWIDL